MYIIFYCNNWKINETWLKFSFILFETDPTLLDISYWMMVRKLHLLNTLIHTTIYGKSESICEAHISNLWNINKTSNSVVLSAIMVSISFDASLKIWRYYYEYLQTFSWSSGVPSTFIHFQLSKHRGAELDWWSLKFDQLYDALKPWFTHDYT